MYRMEPESPHSQRFETNLRRGRFWQYREQLSHVIGADDGARQFCMR